LEVILRFSASSVYFTLRGVEAFANNLMFTVVAIYYVQNVKLSPLELVLVGTTLMTVIFVCEVPTGVIADTYSRRLSVIIGIFLTGLGFSLQAVAPNFALILFCQILWGVGVTCISGALTAWLADEIGEERLAGVLLSSSKYNSIINVLGILSSILLGMFLGITAPIVASGGMYLALGFFLIIGMPETNFRPLPRENRTGWQSLFHTFGEGLNAVRGKPLLTSILWITFFLGAASEGFDRLWEAHFLTNFSFPDLIGTRDPILWFGIIGILFNALGFVTISLFQKRTERAAQNPVVAARLLFVLHTLTIGSIVFLGLAFNFWVALAAVMFKSSLGALIYPLYYAWLAQNIPSQVRATVLSLNGQTDAIGQIAGGPGVGAIGSTFGIRAALVLAGLLLAPALFIYSRVGRKQK
jgi:MFS transporter, DHA3 family, tetracycline resistance protein